MVEENIYRADVDDADFMVQDSPAAAPIQLLLTVFEEPRGNKCSRPTSWRRYVCR